MSIPECVIDGCRFKYNPATARRGYCNSHYKKLKDELSLAKWSRKDVTKPRPPIIEGDIARIPVGRNAKDGYAIVDADMAWLGTKYKWSTNQMGYATQSVGGRKRMQYFILERHSGLYIDHINGDRMDNRRSNLRLVTHQQNIQNSRPRSANGYKGVSYLKKSPNAIKVWRAYIKPENSRQLSLGLYETPEKAAKAYDAAAKEYFGEYAYLNFPNE